MRLDYELLDGDRRLATLHNSFLTILGARFETSGEAWRIELRGFIRTRLRLLREGTTVEAAVVESGIPGNPRTIRLADGRALSWRICNSMEWDLRLEDDRPLAHFEIHDLIPRLRGSVAIAPEAIGMPELLPVIVLGWYLALFDGTG